MSWREILSQTYHNLPTEDLDTSKHLLQKLSSNKALLNNSDTFGRVSVILSREAVRLAGKKTEEAVQQCQFRLGFETGVARLASCRSGRSVLPKSSGQQQDLNHATPEYHARDAEAALHSVRRS